MISTRSHGALHVSDWENARNELYQDLEQDFIEDAINVNGGHLDVTNNITDVTGKQEKACGELMNLTKEMLQNPGWTDCMSALLPDNLDLTPMPAEFKQPGPAWKVAVLQKHAEILEERT